MSELKVLNKLASINCQIKKAVAVRFRLLKPHFFLLRSFLPVHSLKFRTDSFKEVCFNELSN